MGGTYTIASFKHRVSICTMQDVVISSSEIVLARKDVYQAWACIEPKAKSLFSRTGEAVKQSREQQTHLITIRFRRDIDFTSSAWLYEQRLQSGARWFKVLGMVEANEDGEYLTFSCRLVERGADLVAPVASEPESFASPMPQGVKL